MAEAFEARRLAGAGEGGQGAQGGGVDLRRPGPCSPLRAGRFLSWLRSSRLADAQTPTDRCTPCLTTPPPPPLCGAVSTVAHQVVDPVGHVPPVRRRRSGPPPSAAAGSQAPSWSGGHGCPWGSEGGGEGWEGGGGPGRRGQASLAEWRSVVGAATPLNCRSCRIRRRRRPWRRGSGCGSSGAVCGIRRRCWRGGEGVG